MMDVILYRAADEGIPQGKWGARIQGTYWKDSELTVWKSPEGLNTGLKSGLESNSKDGKCTVYKLMVA